MKSEDLNSRRSFLGAVVLGAAASSLSLLSNPLQAALPALSEEAVGDADKWFDKIKGTHRIVYDGSTPHDGFPILWTSAIEQYHSKATHGFSQQDGLMREHPLFFHSATKLLLEFP